MEFQLTRRQPVAMSLRQIFEVYHGRAGLHCYARLKNQMEGEPALTASDVLSLSMVDRPHTLHSGAERCAAYWIQELASRKPQVLFADAAVTSYDETWTAGQLTVTVTGQPQATARLIVFKSAAGGLEERVVTLDTQGRGVARF